MISKAIAIAIVTSLTIIGIVDSKNVHVRRNIDKTRQLKKTKHEGKHAKESKKAKRSKKGFYNGKKSKLEVNHDDEHSFHDIARPGCDSVVAANYTKDAVVGGTLYVFDPIESDNGIGKERSWMTMSDGKKFVDLAHSAIEAGCVPKRRPHMVLPSPNGKYSVTTYFGDQDFHVLSNDDHKIIACISNEYLKPSVFGGNVHTGVWLDDENFLAVDFTGCYNGQCGGVLNKFEFTTDINTGLINGAKWSGSLGHQGVAVARGTSATGPIAVGNNPIGRYADLHFVSDSKGSGSIMNATDMTWVKHFNVNEFGTCGTGGLWIAPHPVDERIVLVVYGNQGDVESPRGSCVFKVDMSSLTIEDKWQLQDNADAHGIAYCTRLIDNELSAIITMRQTANINVMKVADGSYYEKGYDLNANVFSAMDIKWYEESNIDDRNRLLKEDAKVAYENHQLMSDLAFLVDDWLYISARGPKPVSAVKEAYFYHNARPGIFAIKINLDTCTPAKDQSEAFTVTSFERSPEKTSDFHGLHGVVSNGKHEIWAIDQAGTGSIQSFDVYSACSAYDSIDDEEPDFLIGSDNDRK